MAVQLFPLRFAWPHLKPYTPMSLVRMIARLVPPGNLQRLRDIIQTMDEQSKTIYNSKKAALEKGDEVVVHQMSEGKDIMSILCEYSEVRSSGDAHGALVRANLDATDEDKLPEEELIAQMSCVSLLLVLAAI